MTHQSGRFSWRFDQALTLASLVHAGVVRKGTLIPYIMHPAHVARLLEQHGFSEDVAVAGLLHDVLEDAKFGDACLQALLRETFAEFVDVERSEKSFRAATETFITTRFGMNVLELVRSVTEVKSAGSDKLPWRVRKDEQLAHITGMSRDQAALKAADALHNSRSVLRDVQRDGLKACERFNCTADETLWYYGAVADGLRDTLAGHALYSELDAAVFELTEVVSHLLADESSKRRCGFCAVPHEASDRCTEPTTDTTFAVEHVSGQRIRSLAHWFRLAPPVGRERQWVNGRSARETARAWSGLSAPEDVIALLQGSDDFRNFRPATVIPELVTPLDEFGEGRNHDVVVLGLAQGKRVLVGIESKNDEELGPVIGGYLAKTQLENVARLAKGKTRLSLVPARIANLTRVVFGDKPVDLADSRYQLLHGLAGTLIEAASRDADVAVFLLHVFVSASTDPAKVERNEKDLFQFAELLHVGASEDMRAGRLAGPFGAGVKLDVPVGLPFYIGAARTILLGSTGQGKH